MSSIYADHWLYRIIPENRQALSIKQPWKWVTWALLGNDDDGIFGEGPSSGTKWRLRWGGTAEKVNDFSPGKISFNRFLAWQLRNPLHNFTFYVIGFAWVKNIPLIQLALITTKQASFIQKLRSRHAEITEENKNLKVASIFPMGEDSGIYLGIHMLPCCSFRLNLRSWKRLEGYIGWRTEGNFGLCLRLKSMGK